MFCHDIKNTTEIPPCGSWQSFLLEVDTFDQEPRDNSINRAVTQKLHTACTP